MLFRSPRSACFLSRRACDRAGHSAALGNVRRKRMLARSAVHALGASENDESHLVTVSIECGPSRKRLEHAWDRRVHLSIVAKELLLCCRKTLVARTFILRGDDPSGIRKPSSQFHTGLPCAPKPRRGGRQLFFAGLSKAARLRNLARSKSNQPWPRRVKMCDGVPPAGGQIGRAHV